MITPLAVFAQVPGQINLQRRLTDDLGDPVVDGADLQEYIFDSGGLGLDVFAATFGKVNCP